MKTIIFTYLSIILATIAFAQKYDAHWLMGYAGIQDTTFGTSHINFNYSPPLVYRNDTELDYYFSNTSMCTQEGNFLFTSNGIDLFNASDEILLNSQGFNYNEFHEPYAQIGLPVVQGVLSIHSVSEENLYYVFHLKIDYEFVDQDNFFYYCKGLYYSTIDITGDNGNGIMIEKGTPIVEDTLAIGGLTATQHANGRDWWILMPERNNNRYYRILLDPEGIHLLESQDFNSYTESGFGQANFSPDGTWYVRNNMIGTDENDDFIDIYRFDRCIGMLSEHQRFSYGKGFIAGGGAVISPNSQYLYIGHHVYVYQLDLFANDILASKDTIAIWDGFAEQGQLATTFFSGQNTLDGKVYFNCSNGVSYMHLIHNPNGQGEYCRFEQRGVDLPTYNASSLPNFPNYRLGPFDGSICDTLGIDNIPLAAFNYYADSSDNLTINFWDYSYYEPTQWEWTFGDTEEGIGQTPVHTYSTPGTYEVCLTASNEYGSDSLCKLLEFTATGIKEILSGEEKVSLFPNPVSDELTISFTSILDENAILNLYNSLGQIVNSYSLNKGQRNYSISLNQEEKGIYFYSIESQQKIIDSGKMIILK